MGGVAANKTKSNILKKGTYTSTCLHQLLQKYLKQLQLAWMDMIQEKQKLKEDQ
jgi:hypothetical protein